jgi:glycosyltransferase involved in cell wall biosynthesis
MPAKKKKILFHSNYSKILSGFGKNARNVLRYLALTGKYEIVELSNGVTGNHPDLSKLPWKAVGGLPGDQAQLDKINQDPNLSRSAQYGGMVIDKIIQNEKPDVYIGVEDIWGVSDNCKKPWWNKINCMVWTTLDSLPILPQALTFASKIKNYYVWASFAEKAMHEKGYNHVKTLHGALDTSNFFRLDDKDRLGLRSRFKIDQDSFIIGFVFRNQLRKSVPNLLEGFKLFKNDQPKSKAKLLLHTNFAEGWDIHALIEEKGINPEDVLCTYYCGKCKTYEVKPFSGQKLDCKYCGSKGSQNTVNIGSGVNEPQLNEIYNLMDVYCHPFTSGGQEIPIQEAKLTELITLVTNYSCGEDCCGIDAGGFPLDWAEYREPGTQFIKASTFASSIFKNLKKVFKMDLLKRSSMGKKARQFVIDNYSIDVIGSKLESIIDGMPEIDYNFDFTPEKRDPNYNPPEIESHEEWLIDIYKNILKVDLDKSDPGHIHWMDQFKNGASRESVLDYFKSVAVQENQKQKQKSNILDFDDVVKNEGNAKALFVCNGSIEEVFLVTSLLPSFHKQNPGFDVFFATDKQTHAIIGSNPYIYKCIDYQKEMGDELIMIKSAKSEGYFDFYYNFDNLNAGLSINNKIFATHE